MLFFIFVSFNFIFKTILNENESEKKTKPSEVKLNSKSCLKVGGAAYTRVRLIHEFLR